MYSTFILKMNLSLANLETCILDEEWSYCVAKLRPRTWGHATIAGQIQSD